MCACVHVRVCAATHSEGFGYKGSPVHQVVRNYVVMVGVAMALLLISSSSILVIVTVQLHVVCILLCKASPGTPYCGCLTKAQ